MQSLTGSLYLKMSEDVLLSDSESFHSGVSEKDFKENYKLHYLVWCNDYDDVAKYIRNPSFDMFEFERVDQRGRTPLHIAISFGHFEIARLLLASGKFLFSSSHFLVIFDRVPISFRLFLIIFCHLFDV